MTAIRSLFAQRHLAVLLCAAALLLKLAVPTGYMIGQIDGHAAIILCPGSAPASAGADMTMAMAGHVGMHHDAAATHAAHPGKHSGDGDGHEMPCAFAGLAAPGLAATDPIQLALLVAFIMAVAVAAPAILRPASAPYLRPPLRGPPVLSRP